ncbi:MAG: hypothetical protein AAF429_12810 [Pseudomonadota bacterium]
MIKDKNEYHIAFEKDNARYESREAIIKTFVPTVDFEELFTDKHQIVMGCRGSGKTVLMKMLTLPYIMESDLNEKIELVLKEKIVGIRASTDLRFVGGLKSKPWLTEVQEEIYFVWKLNLALLKAAVEVLPDIIKYFSRNADPKASQEVNICAQVNNLIFSSTEKLNSKQLIKKLELYEIRQKYEIQKNFRSRDSSLVEIDPMAGDLLEPFIYLRTLIESICGSENEFKWYICFDEVEFLTERQLRILNSLLRTDTGNITFKIATMPYSHTTLETNIGMPISEEDDFRYLYLDHGFSKSLVRGKDPTVKFAELVFKKRINYYFGRDVNINLSDALGLSNLESYELKDKDKNFALNKISIHCDDRTNRRAISIAGKGSSFSDYRHKKRFSEQIWRKISGAIKLREAVSETQGNISNSAYTGTSVFIRCTDGVPRRMINLFFAVAKESYDQFIRRQLRTRTAKTASIAGKIEKIRLSKASQYKLIKNYSESRFERILAVPKRGLELMLLIEQAGTYFEYRLHHHKISTDLHGAIKLNPRDDQIDWSTLQEGVKYGVVFPNRNYNVGRVYNANKLTASFRMAFALAPKFNLLPRRGKDTSLAVIRRFNSGGKAKFDPKQIKMKF